MKKYLLISGAVGLLFVLGCNKPEDNCEEEKLTAAFLFDYPDTVQVGESFNLNVNYVVENSCGDSIKFEGQQYDNTLEVRLRTYYLGCNCVDEFEEKSADYPITFIEPATYELKLWVSEDEYETYVVVAEE